MDINSSETSISSLRIISWNCNRNFARKFSELSKFDAEIMFIQECEKLPKDYFPGKKFYWMGNNAKKGLAIIVPNYYEIETLVVNDSLIYFLPLKTRNLYLMSAWAFNGRAKRFGRGCSGYIADALHFYDHDVASTSKVIIAGDFNNGPRWDYKGFHRNNFSHIHNELSARGLSSSYHSYFNEFPGEEKHATHYHHRNLGKPFHIDYVFTREFKVSNVVVGEFKNWISHSDHMPIIVDLEYSVDR